MSGTGRDHTFQEIRVQSLHAPAFEFREPTETRGHGDFAEHDRRLEEIAREAAARAASDTALVLVPPIAALEEMVLVLDGDEDLLEDARANAAEGAYELALELLAEYLQAHPEHQEGRYLRAYCLYRLDGPQQSEALEILGRLRTEEGLPEELRERIRDLRRELRRRLTPPEIAAYTEKVRSDPLGAQARLQAFLELAPEEGMVSYLLALAQARQNRLELALDTAERGAAAADVDRGEVAALARRLRLALLGTHAAPATSAFKTGDFDRARRELARMDPRWRRSAVLDDFDAHLALLIGRPRGERPLPPPRLTAERAEDLYSLIAEDDCRHASMLMQTGRAVEAERLLAHLLTLLPRFAWLNFLCAACLYRLRRSPDRAAACAEIARTDRTLTQAGELLEAIRSWQEATVINPAVDEYLAAMESVQGGVSVDRLAALRRRLTALERQLPTLRGAARTEGGAQVVEQFGQAIADRLREIDDAMVVGGLYEKYDRVMSSVQGGIKGGAEADRLDGSLAALATEIKSVRKNAKESARGQLDELTSLVTRRRGELEEVKASIQVSDLVGRFNDLAQQGRYANQYTLRAQLTTILQEAQKLNRRKSRLDARSRELLDQLIGTLSRTLR
ncbi:alkyl sulfatase dimerization domain-containing protein [Streptomyces sp. CA-249302]|uniref:alkyl sulfatase dimerization domain-containing protein n=1 Tax=Streptomyces sp. CA-249302 TaxID=3240058 RepID=UPI003D8FDC9D